jgi:MFS family permease
MSGYMFVSVTGGSCGLLVGGALVQALGWHWIFLINVPVGAIAILLARAVLRQTAVPGLRGGMDVGGAALVTASAMLAIYALVATADHAWTAPAVVLPGGAAVAALAGFAIVEARHANPLMPLRILRIRPLIASSVVRGFLVMAMYAVSLFGTLDLSRGLAFEPMRVGLAFLPQSAIVAVLSLGITARLMQRFGPRRVLVTGLSLIAIALWTFMRREPDAPYWPGRFLSFALVGVGAGMSFLPLVTIAMSEVPPADAGLGSAVVNLSLQLAAAIDVSILGAVASFRTEVLAGQKLAPRDALIGGYRAGYAVAAVGAAVAVVLALVLLRGRPAGTAAAAPAPPGRA